MYKTNITKQKRVPLLSLFCETIFNYQLYRRCSVLLYEYKGFRSRVLQLFLIKSGRAVKYRWEYIENCFVFLRSCEGFKPNYTLGYWSCYSRVGVRHHSLWFVRSYLVVHYCFWKKSLSISCSRSLIRFTVLRRRISPFPHYVMLNTDDLTLHFFVYID